MGDALDQIFNEIRKEYEYANKKWGTEFDDKNTLNDWVTYITMYASEAAKIENSEEEKLSKLLKTANLAVSALVTYERNNGFPDRHYDKGGE